MRRSPTSSVPSIDPEVITHVCRMKARTTRKIAKPAAIDLTQSKIERESDFFIPECTPAGRVRFPESYRTAGALGLIETPAIRDAIGLRAVDMRWTKWRTILIDKSRALPFKGI